MGYQYTQAQVDQIKVLYDLGDFPGAYNLAADFADGNAGSDQPSVLWLRGAAKINAGVGSESAFIRGYTAAQYLARFGQALDLDLIQAASDAIATKVLDDIINGKSLPSIGAIAIDDATPAANMIFNGSMGGWAGNPLFLFLGYNQTFFDNVLHQQDASVDTYDALAMIKFLGSTGTFFDNLSNSLGAIGLNPGAAVTVANAGLALNSYLEDAYGGQNLNGQVSTGEVILGRVNADDTIVGTAGRDFIHGGGGDDTMLASGGNDLIDGGAGDDTADYRSVSTFMNVVIKAETSGVPYTGSVTSAAAGFDTLFAVENIIGGGGDDLFMVQSLPAHLTSIAGGEGVDELNTFYLPAAVNINAMAGTLTSDGMSINISGFERIEGTGASDTFVLSGIETEIRGGGGSDTVDLSQSPGSGAPLRLFDVETIIASEQADILILSGGSTQTVHGRGGNDEIDGGDGPSHLYGESGRDILRGGGGNDHLFGGDEDDELHGGDGADVLDVHLHHLMMRVRFPSPAPILHPGSSE